MRQISFKKDTFGMFAYLSSLVTPKPVIVDPRYKEDPRYKDAVEKIKQVFEEKNGWDQVMHTGGLCEHDAKQIMEQIFIDFPEWKERVYLCRWYHNIRIYAGRPPPNHSCGEFNFRDGVNKTFQRAEYDPKCSPFEYDCQQTPTGEEFPWYK